MQADVFERVVLDVLASYWRLVFAVHHLQAATAHDRDLGTGSIPVVYSNVPEFGHATGFLTAETVQVASDRLNRHQDERLAADFLLAMITELERFLTDKLNVAGLSVDGTLGQLQRRAELHYQLGSRAEVEQMDEVRERRNAWVHSHGAKTAKHDGAASKIYSKSGGFVLAPHLAATAKPDERYLTYAAHVLISYARCYP